MCSSFKAKACCICAVSNVFKRLKGIHKEEKKSQKELLLFGEVEEVFRRRKIAEVSLERFQKVEGIHF